MTNRHKLRVLFVQIELPGWRQARQWSYDMQLGFEEGLSANNVEFITLTSTWFNYSQEICTGRKFDQVWINDVSHLGCSEDITEQGLEWLASLAPIRIGIITETTSYSPQEYAAEPGLMEYQSNLRTNLKYITHLAVADETDVVDLGKMWGIPVMWMPVPVPDRFITDVVPEPRIRKALFSGTRYGPRAKFLEDPALENMLSVVSSPENHTIYPYLFDALPMHRYYRWSEKRIAAIRRGTKNSDNRTGYPRLAVTKINNRFPVYRAYPIYIMMLRHIRRKAFAMYMQGIQTGCAVVNLSSRFKGYASRVVEGMAAGRPVISWHVPDRPQVEDLFEDGQEILLFAEDNPVHLAAQIRRILNEPDLSFRLVEKARRKLRRFHTTEIRVCQILDWVESGVRPVYY